MKIVARTGSFQNPNKETYSVKIEEDQIIKVVYSKSIDQFYIEEDDFGNMVFAGDEITPVNIELSEYRAKETIKFVTDYVGQHKAKLTKFELELYGYKGKFWRKDAEKRLVNVRKEIVDGEITIDENGVARNCIGRVVMSDGMDIIEHITKKFNRRNTEKALEEETRKFIKEYREQQKDHEYSQEELAEMRAAFGEGTTVVDVFTGKEIQL